MPPRIPFPARFGVNVCFKPARSASYAQLPLTSVCHATTMAQRRKQKDPYALAQAKQRKDANLSRQAVLLQQRNAAEGDPVRGITTPFLESFDNVGGSADIRDALEAKGIDGMLLNHFVTPAEFEASIAHSAALTEPIPSATRDFADPTAEKQDREKYEAEHANAIAALGRIMGMGNASQEDKTRANVRRCIEIFGRHQTDGRLRPRAPPSPASLGGKPLPEKTPRAGPDTGSSEVQIAILTAKIRVLADQLAMGGKKDKINKRNLRVMVHKRQKLLQYLRRKERGGDRWQHVIEKLGLTEGTWKGEISL